MVNGSMVKIAENKTVQITSLRIGESFPLLRKEPCLSNAPLRI